MKNSHINIERELIQLLKDGNDKAFEIIYNKTKGKLMGFLKKSLPKSEDEESVLQEIYLKIWSVRNSLDENRSFETFLYTISRNMVTDLLRKRFYQQKYLEELNLKLKESFPNQLDALEKLEYRELERKLNESIGKLPKRRKNIFLLNRLKGLTYKEIANKLNITESTVDYQMRSSLNFLRKELNDF